MPRGWLLFVATFSCWAMVAASSQAAVVFQAEGPSTLSLPGTKTVAYSLQMVSGADPEQFTVDVELPVVRGPDGRPGGVSISQLGFPTLSGPGTLGPTSLTNFDGLQAFTCRGLTSGQLATSQVFLPPFSDSRLTAHFEVVSRGFPLMGDSYAPTFVASSALLNGMTGTIGPDQRLTPPAPTFSPPLGVHIDLQTQPFTSSDVELRRGTRIRFAGNTSPAAPNQLIRISYRFLNKFLDVEGTIVDVRTNELGQFRWPAPKKTSKNKKKQKRRTGWKPNRLGVYLLSASLVPQSANIGPSQSCARDFTLKKK